CLTWAVTAFALILTGARTILLLIPAKLLRTLAVILALARCARRTLLIALCVAAILLGLLRALIAALRRIGLSLRGTLSRITLRAHSFATLTAAALGLIRSLRPPLTSGIACAGF